MDQKISIIVPIYKVEKYLIRCIESLINQTHRNIEIILVDDGSPDGCGQICDTYAKQDNRIKVIHKENGGLSDARNAGVEIATGEYIGFIDSDDWIEKDMYEILLTNMINNQADISVCGVNDIRLDGIVSKTKDGQIYSFNKLEGLQNLLKGNYFGVVVWNKLYKKKVIQGLTFPKGKICEDVFFTHQAFYNSDKIVYIDLPKYNYDMTREGSICREKFNPNRIDLIEAYRSRCDFFKEKGLMNFERYSQAAYFTTMINLYDSFLQLEDQTIAKNIKNEINDSMKMILSNKDLGNKKIKFILFRINPKLFKGLWSTYLKLKSKEKILGD